MEADPTLKPHVGFQASEIRRQQALGLTTNFPSSWAKHAKAILEADEEQIFAKIDRMSLMQDAAALSVNAILQEDGIIEADEKRIKDTIKQREELLTQLTDEERDGVDKLTQNRLARIYESRNTS